MGWEPERNRYSLSPHGLKEAQGHAMRAVHDAHCVSGPEMPPGILGPRPLNSDPHARGPKSPVYFPDDKRSPHRK